MIDVRDCDLWCCFACDTCCAGAGAVLLALLVSCLLCMHFAGFIKHGGADGEKDSKQASKQASDETKAKKRYKNSREEKENRTYARERKGNSLHSPQKIQHWVLGEEGE